MVYFFEEDLDADVLCVALSQLLAEYPFLGGCIRGFHVVRPWDDLKLSFLLYISQAALKPSTRMAVVLSRRRSWARVCLCRWLSLPFACLFHWPAVLPRGRAPALCGGDRG
jgi:hypothetical protein